MCLQSVVGALAQPVLTIPSIAPESDLLLRSLEVLVSSIATNSKGRRLSPRLEGTHCNDDL